MNFDVAIDIPGKFNVLNSLCAITICRHFNVSEDDIVKALKKIKVRVGWNCLLPGNYSVMIDYAHNAMSLRVCLLP